MERNTYTDKNNDPEYTKSLHDVSGVLDHLNKFGHLGNASMRLRYATLVYMIAQQGIKL